MSTIAASSNLAARKPKSPGEFRERTEEELPKREDERWLDKLGRCEPDTKFVILGIMAALLGVGLYEKAGILRGPALVSMLVVGSIMGYAKLRYLSKQK